MRQGQVQESRARDAKNKQPQREKKRNSEKGGGDRVQGVPRSESMKQKAAGREKEKKGGGKEEGRGEGEGHVRQSK